VPVRNGSRFTIAAVKLETYTPRYLRTAGPRRGASGARRYLVLAGVVLILFSLTYLAAGFLRPSIPSSPVGDAVAGGSPVAVGDDGAAVAAGASDAVSGPGDDTLKLTVPKMRRARGVPVRTATASDPAELDAGAIRISGTGLPWEEDSNVYIAGHRLGYAGTGSFLIFYDLGKLRAGDRVELEDARGTRYVYEVFDRLFVYPNESRVTRPVPGKRIVSLQTCPLPDYRQRLIVRAELREVREPTSSPANRV
jgi:sortase A